VKVEFLVSQNGMKTSKQGNLSGTVCTVKHFYYVSFSSVKEQEGKIEAFTNDWVTFFCSLDKRQLKQMEVHGVFV
jgi:hypothetical protein